MTDEIIIDGVDVAGCEYMLNNKIQGKQHCPAKAMPYAKETSCICRKSIDTPYNFCKHNPNCYYKQLKRLEQECEDLKKQITILDDETIVVEITEKQFEEYQQLKKALTEIKNVIGDRNKEGEAFCDDRLYKIEQILQKCEVINE